MYKKGNRVVNIAQKVGTSPSIVYSWIQKYKDYKDKTTEEVNTPMQPESTTQAKQASAPIENPKISQDEIMRHEKVLDEVKRENTMLKVDNEILRSECDVLKKAIAILSNQNSIKNWF